MKNLIDEINKEFPVKEPGGFNSAVFFHHTSDGKLVTCSPMLCPAPGQPIDINFMVSRLLLYSNACKQMADQMINITLNKN